MARAGAVVACRLWRITSPADSPQFRSGVRWDRMSWSLGFGRVDGSRESRS